MKANTLHGLAHKMGLDAEELSRTVARYNELADKGHDDDFFKPANYLQPIRTPAFYAVKQRGGTMFNTWGGLVVDDQFRVLDKDWKYIPGLYVAGENMACGARMSFSLPAGRLVGKIVSKSVAGKRG
jgi:fumarate reductase flavoprotein subunit